MTNIRLDGGVSQLPDGSWRVACWFSGLTQPEAQHVSAWLERLMAQHLHEIAEDSYVKPPTVEGHGHA